MNSIVNDQKLFTSSIPSSHGNSRVALIGFGSTAYNHSIRSIAAYLRAQKYNVSIIQCLSEGGDNIFLQLSERQLELLKKQHKRHGKRLVLKKLLLYLVVNM